jgi:hypothetical protein
MMPQGFGRIRGRLLVNQLLFHEGSAATVLCLRSIINEEDPILWAEHDEDGNWYFFNARTLFSGEDLCLMPLGKLVRIDPSITELADLPRGWRAWRWSQGEPWMKESRRGKELSGSVVKQVQNDPGRASKAWPPGTPSTVELQREGRDR